MAGGGVSQRELQDFSRGPCGLIAVLGGLYGRKLAKARLLEAFPSSRGSCSNADQGPVDLMGSTSHHIPPGPHVALLLGGCRGQGGALDWESRDLRAGGHPLCSPRCLPCSHWETL